MASQLLGIKTRFTNDLGSPLVGGQVYTYFAGTSTNQDSYSDAALTVPNTNPVILDDTGSADIFLKGSYRIRVFDKSGRFIEEQDNVTQVSDADVSVLKAEIGAQKLDTGILTTTKLSGEISRSLAQALGDFVSVKRFGAVGDGIYDDTFAVQKALNTGLSIYFPCGAYRITDELYIKTHGQKIGGGGMGAGYTSGDNNPVISWVDATTLLFDDPVDPAVRYIKTRALPRPTADSPQDMPLSTALNIQGENFVMSDMCVRLNISNVPTDPLTDSPTNYGADWDVGIFNGCRVHMSLTNVAVVGYWRQASIWCDVTRAHSLPDIPNYKGVEFTKGTVSSGADGAQMTNVLTYGGRWGLKIQGAKSIDGSNVYPENYVDAISGLTVKDARGAFGFSDFLAMGCSFYGTDHHTRRRRTPIANPPNVKTDTAGGTLSIDGITGNSEGVLQGHRFIGCRFATYEPFNVRLDCSNRDVFIGCHNETHGTALDASGNSIPYNAQNYYGSFAKTAQTRKTKIISSNTHPMKEYWKLGFNDTVVFSDHNSESYDLGNFYGKTYNTFGSDVTGAEYSNLVILSGKDTGASIINFANGADVFAATLRYVHETGELSYRNPAYSTNSGGRMLDIKAKGTAVELKTPSHLELNVGNFYVKNALGDLVFSSYSSSRNMDFSGSLRSTGVGTQDVGSSTNPWKRGWFKDSVNISSPDGSTWAITVSNTGSLTTNKI